MRDAALKQDQQLRPSLNQDVISSSVSLPPQVVYNRAPHLITSEEDVKAEELRKIEEAKSRLEEMEKEYGGRIRNIADIQSIKDMFTCIIC